MSAKLNAKRNAIRSRIECLCHVYWISDRRNHAEQGGAPDAIGAGDLCVSTISGVIFAEVEDQ